MSEQDLKTGNDQSPGNNHGEEREDLGLPFTGERFTPECVREIWYEHWHRYAFAGPLCKDMKVLDIACGEGYGSHLLARFAAEVIGIDVDPQAVAHANAKYAAKGRLRYQQGDCAKLPLADASVDRVVSFETLEHIEAQEEMIAECRRVLRPDGCLIISTPDRSVYNQVMGAENEFHVRELERGEFISLIEQQFPAIRLLGQKLLFMSALWDEKRREGGWTLAHGEEGAEASPRTMPWQPVYHVALCAGSAQQLPQTPTLHLFADAEESVYRHYNEEVGKHIRAGLLLAERDQTISELQTALSEVQARPVPWWRRLFTRPQD